MKNTYGIYSVRLEYRQFNKKLGEVKADNVEQVKAQIKKPITEGGMNLNPFYVVIIDETMGAKIIEHNRHLAFVEDREATDKIQLP
jgi:hypothetical protein